MIVFIFYGFANGQIDKMSAKIVGVMHEADYALSGATGDCIN